MNLWHEFIKGGIIMWPILLCSIVGLAIIIDKYIIIYKTKKGFNEFLNQITILVKKNDLKAAIEFCKTHQSSAANIIYEGLRKLKFGHNRVQEAMDTVAKKEIMKLEKGLTMLASVSGIAPMLGFLGTVTGMVSAFKTVESFQGAVGPGDLAGGIYEALITTVFGLIVGIPCLIYYNQFMDKIKKIVLDFEYHANEIIDIIEELND